MSDQDTTGKLPDEELLLPYERKIMKGEWGEYFKAARQCWLAFLNNFPELWDLFSQLDGIFVRELGDCQKQQREEVLVPLILFAKAHKSIRVSIELAFSTHFTEAFDAARGAVEAAAYAHKMHRDPEMAIVWLKKDEGKAQKNAFDNEFVFYKVNKLFPKEYPVMSGLYEAYCRFSEWGSHTTITSVGIHLKDSSTKNSYIAFTNYVGADLEMGARIIWALLHAFLKIENVLYDVFQTRLLFDSELGRSRASFEATKTRIASALSRRFNLVGPLIVSPPRR